MVADSMLRYVARKQGMYLRRQLFLTHGPRARPRPQPFVSVSSLLTMERLAAFGQDGLR